MAEKLLERKVSILKQLEELNNEIQQALIKEKEDRKNHIIPSIYKLSGVNSGITKFTYTNTDIRGKEEDCDPTTFNTVLTHSVTFKYTYTSPNTSSSLNYPSSSSSTLRNDLTPTSLRDSIKSELSTSSTGVDKNTSNKTYNVEAKFKDTEVVFTVNGNKPITLMKTGFMQIHLENIIDMDTHEELLTAKNLFKSAVYQPIILLWGVLKGDASNYFKLEDKNIFAIEK